MRGLPPPIALDVAVALLPAVNSNVFSSGTAVIVLAPFILLLAIPPTAPDLSKVTDAPTANPCNALVTLTVPLPSIPQDYLFQVAVLMYHL